MPHRCPHCGEILRLTAAELATLREGERQELRMRAVKLWEEGKTQKQIGDALVRTQAAARQLLIEAGIDTSKKPPRIANEQYQRRMERLAKALRMRDDERLTYREIGARLGVGAQRARQLYQSGQRRRARGQALPESSD